MVWRKRLPIDGEHAMALQISKGAVIADHVEAVVDSFEGAARTMAAVLALAHVGAHKSDSFVGAELLHALKNLRLGQVGVRVADGCKQLVFGLRIPVEQLDRGGWLYWRTAEDAINKLGRAIAGTDHVFAPATAAIGKIDAAQEARDDLAQFVQHELGVMLSFGQRMRLHAQQQHLKRLAGAVDAHVAERRCWQHATHRIESLGAGGLAIDEIAVVGAAWHRGANMLGDLVDEQAVRVEHAVHVAHVAGAKRAVEHRWVSVEPVAATEARVVRDVASALLEVAHQPTPLEHLGQDV